jgi:surface protein
MFNNCTNLTLLDLSSFNTSSLTSTTTDIFRGCINLKTIKLGAEVATTKLSSGSFGNSTSNYTGYNSRSTGENKLYVPVGATGYDTGYWLDPLQNPEKCGFTIEYYNDIIGVYIYGTDKNLYEIENWDNRPAGVDGNFVFIGTENHRFLVYKNRLDTTNGGINTTYAWCPSEYTKTELAQ